MSAMTVSLIVFACVFGGALLGMVLRATLPSHHLTGDSRDVVKLGMGLVGTLAALVLGLLVASAKSSFDAQGAELRQLAADIALLDRLLAHYGPESKDTRDRLRDAVASALERLWSKDPAGFAESPSARGEAFYDSLQRLSPKDDGQRSVHAQAVRVATTVGAMRWLMYEQRTATASVPLLIVLVLWLTVIFGSFGLFGPANATVIASLCVAALSVAGAIFLILEMYAPYSGLMQVSSAPLRAVLAHLGQ
jgi:hypothetical protein